MKSKLFVMDIVVVGWRTGGWRMSSRLANQGRDSLASSLRPFRPYESVLADADPQGES